MRKPLLILLSLSVFLGCKEIKSSEETIKTEESITTEDGALLKSYDQNDGLTTMRGDFIYYEDASVLQTKNEIYGVVIDDTMHELNAQVQQYKKEATDMVPVTVRVRKFPKPAGEEGWDFRVEIKEIITVHQPPNNNSDVIKIGEK